MLSAPSTKQMTDSSTVTAITHCEVSVMTCFSCELPCSSIALAENDETKKNFQNSCMFFTAEFLHEWRANKTQHFYLEEFYIKTFREIRTN